MAVLTVAAFLSKWEALFPTNGNREITASRMRDFRQDIADSFQPVAGQADITSWKSPCAVATTGNITLSGEQTIDGVLTSGSRVLVKNQTTTSQNGIYVSDAGAWSRSTDADDAAELEGAAVGVTQGTTQQNTVWLQTSDNITLGSTAIAWQQIGFGFGSGITNSAANNELMKSDGTNAVGSGLFSTFSGGLTVPSGLTVSDQGALLGDVSGAVDTVSYPVTLRHETTESAIVPGIGTGIRFQTETASGNIEQGATIESVATDVTGGSEDFDLVFKTMSGGSTAAERMRVRSDGRVSNIANPTSAATKAYVDALNATGGTTSPTAVGVANVDSILGCNLVYCRVANTVSVSGAITVDPTAAGGTLTRVGIPLPVASNLSTNALYGVAVDLGNTLPGAVISDGTNNRAELQFNSNSTIATSFRFTFQYLVD
jgi:hypothetical protein